jgi:hypothetical protein
MSLKAPPIPLLSLLKKVPLYLNLQSSNIGGLHLLHKRGSVK